MLRVRRGEWWILSFRVIVRVRELGLLTRASHIYYRVKMEEREILGKVRCSQESPEVV